MKLKVLNIVHHINTCKNIIILRYIIDASDIYGRITHLDMLQLANQTFWYAVQIFQYFKKLGFLVNYKRQILSGHNKRLCFVFFFVAYSIENVHRYDKRNLVISVKLFAVVKQMLTYAKKGKFEIILRVFLCFNT